jgi:hypothetical protein
MYLNSLHSPCAWSTIWFYIWGKNRLAHKVKWCCIYFSNSYYTTCFGIILICHAETCSVIWIREIYTTSIYFVCETVFTPNIKPYVYLCFMYHVHKAWWRPAVRAETCNHIDLDVIMYPVIVYVASEGAEIMAGSHNVDRIRLNY